MPYLIRQAVRDDIPRLSELLDGYMRETYQTAWAGTAQLLGEHGFGNEFELTVAEDAGHEIIAFVAVVAAYDLHHCMKGGEIIDLFVCPTQRGRGVALLLITDVAAQVQGRGGTYLKGGAVDSPGVRRLYERCAMCLAGGECYVSGRAFRRLAELSGKSVREVIRGLPKAAWNREP